MKLQPPAGGRNVVCSLAGSCKNLGNGEIARSLLPHCDARLATAIKRAHCGAAEAPPMRQSFDLQWPNNIARRCWACKVSPPLVERRGVKRHLDEGATWWWDICSAPLFLTWATNANQNDLQR